MKINQRILDYYLSNINDQLNIGCEISSQITSYILKELDIDHQLNIGILIYNNSAIVYPHCWCSFISNGIKFIIDYQIRRWLGDDDQILNGIFRENKLYLYNGINWSSNPDCVPHLVKSLSFSNEEQLDLNKLTQKIKYEAFTG